MQQMNKANDNTRQAEYGVVIGVVHDDPSARAILAGEEVLHAIRITGAVVPIRLDVRRFRSREALEQAYARACEIGQEKR
jgi:hypothetical protein